MIKILLHGFFDPSPDLSPRTVSALALRALADTVYSGWDQGWDQKSRVIIYMYKQAAWQCHAIQNVLNPLRFTNLSTLRNDAHSNVDYVW